MQQLVQTNQTAFIDVGVDYLARWSWIDVPPSTDAEAEPFGPPPAVPRGERLPVLGAHGRPKDVLYLPVKRREGRERFPRVSLAIDLLRAGSSQSLRVPAWVGARLTFEVRDVWSPGARGGVVTLGGALDANLGARVEIPPETVAAWLQPSGPLGARLNQNLLDFRFEIPSIRIAGRPLRGQSLNRLFFYRRRTIVFLPGVFGSQVHVSLPDGRRTGFPDFRATLARGLEPLEPITRAAVAVQDLLDQRAGALECDGQGQPLLDAEKPRLLTLRGFAYDVFDAAAAARRKLYEPLPEKFRINTLEIWPYDWRLDLTASARALVEALRARQHGSAPNNLRGTPDSDDEIALVGHSTGGLIIRRALGEPGMQELVSHAFFVNVPFQGAPKALGVLLTGCDPPFGGTPLASRMIPFVEPRSLAAIALTMPIVYHLAPAASSEGRPATSPARPPGAPPDIEADKAAFVAAAIDSGLVAGRMVVPDRAALTPAERASLAAGADRWHAFWTEHTERERGRALYDALPGSAATLARRTSFAEEVARRGLEPQLRERVPVGWNAELARRAHVFHQESERIAAEGRWADRAFVSYSVVSDPTTTALHLTAPARRPYRDAGAFMAGERITVADFAGGDARPPGPDAAGPRASYAAWSREAGQLVATDWVLDWWAVARSGDGTVPLASQLAFGGPATFCGPIGGDPVHKDAPSVAWVWERIYTELQDHAAKRKE